MKHTKVIQKCSIKQIKNSGNLSIRKGGGVGGTEHVLHNKNVKMGTASALSSRYREGWGSEL